MWILSNKHKYFTYFGCEMRSLNSELNKLDAPRRMVKRYSQMNLHENVKNEIYDSKKLIPPESNPEVIKKIKVIYLIFLYY